PAVRSGGEVARTGAPGRQRRDHRRQCPRGAGGGCRWRRSDLGHLRGPRPGGGDPALPRAARRSPGGSLRSMRSTRVLPLLIAVVTMIPFLPSLSGEFLNWDDGVGLVTNEAYRGL